MRLHHARKPLDRIAPLLVVGLLLVPAEGASRRNVFFSGFPPGSVISCDGLVLGTLREEGSAFSLFIPEGSPTFRVEHNGDVLLERTFLIEKGKTLYLTPGKTGPVTPERPAPAPPPPPAPASAPAAVRPPGPPVESPQPAAPRTPALVVTVTPGTRLPASPAAPGKPAKGPAGRGVAESLEDAPESSFPTTLALSVLVMAFIGVWGWRRVHRTLPAADTVGDRPEATSTAPAEADDALVAAVSVEEADPAFSVPLGKGPKPDFLEDLHLRETQATLGIRRPKATTDPPFILDIQDFKIRDDS
ncbi:MAG: hypothetical protein KA419_19790 [Acidobacteria bacterium]|nr:hypothetical protein [Acidobacteriota bacterium]